MAGEIGSALVGAGGGLVGAGLSAAANFANIREQGKSRELQERMFNEQMDYAKATQQTTWDREDTALQRQIEDARASGLSPLAVVGSGGASSGQVVSQPNAPTPITPQYDAAQVAQGVSSAGLAAQSAVESGNARRHSLHVLSEQIYASYRELAATLNNVLQVAREGNTSREAIAQGDRASAETIAADANTSREAIANADRIQALDTFNRQLAVNSRLTDSNIARNSAETASREYKNFLDQMGAQGIRYWKITNSTAPRLQQERLIWSQASMAYLASLPEDGWSVSASSSGGGNAGVNLGDRGSGLSISAGGQGASASSESHTNASRNERLYLSWLAANPYPVSRSELRRLYPNVSW